MQIVLIFDLGGGTFDVSIIKIINGETFEIKAVAGDNHLGGEDFDNLLVNYFAQEYKRNFGADLKTNQRSLRRLRTACERAKRTLSSTTEASIEIDSLFEGNDFCSSITRARFEILCNDLFQSTMDPIVQALGDAGMERDEIDEVVMVGGSTRIPQIQKLLSDFFNDKKINYTINPDEAVAYGAAVRAASLSGEDCGHIQNVKLFDVVPLSLGISVGREGEMSTVIKRNSKIPCEMSKPFSTMADNQVTVSIRAYEGERLLVDDNNFLGEFKLTGITPAPRGVTEIEVLFKVNTDGILTVTAKEIGKDSVCKELTIDKKTTV
jgi:heat shock 70kDa protein 1/2/6/8